MKTIVDSSIWIAHFKKSDKHLISLLEADDVLVHAFVLQELYLGKPKGKDFDFERLAKLPQLPVLTTEEFFLFCDEYKVSAKGIGCVDTHLLASAILHKVEIYTHDKKLQRLYRSLV